MIDVIHDELIDPKTAAKLPAFRNKRTGKPAHVAKMYRLFSHGARDAHGNRIRLETVRLPDGLRTSAGAVQQFINQLTNPGTTYRLRTNSYAVAQADRALAAAGI